MNVIANICEAQAANDMCLHEALCIAHVKRILHFLKLTVFCHYVATESSITNPKYSSSSLQDADSHKADTNPK